jgi:hypothetical protein
MLVLFTDFGWQDPYVGQMKAVLAAQAPGVPVVDLLHGVPDFNPHAGAQLLAALAGEFPAGSVFLCVVDPGVGGPRQGLVAEADGRWYVGPDNGLLSIAAGRAREVRYWRIVWRPERISDSFHGRDLFAPVAARVATGLSAGLLPAELVEPISTPEVCFDTADLPRIVYIDHYGNAWTGLRAGLVDALETLEVKGRRLSRRRTFQEAAKGEAFWYVNSVGLVELAVNRGSAAAQLGLTVGDPVRQVMTPAGPVH